MNVAVRGALQASPAAQAGRLAARLERACAFVPAAIIVYVLLQFAIRLLLPGNLEVDDAELVGQAYWAWGYPNSHPPLYSWIVRLCHDLSGSWVVATAAPKGLLLGAGAWLTYDAGRRAGGSRTVGALAAASLLLVPVVLWKTQAKMTHSVLAFAAVAAVLHATVLVAAYGRRRDFVWLGLAAAAGVLAKYNVLLFLAGLVLAVIATPEIRRAFAPRRILVAAVLAVLLVAPHLVWALHHPHHVSERLYVLQLGDDGEAPPPGSSALAAGLVSLLGNVLVSTAPALAICMLAWRVFPAPDTGRTAGGELRRTMGHLTGVLLLAIVADFALSAAVGGFRHVHERYLLAFAPAFSLWLALRLPLDRRPRASAGVLAAAAAAAVAALIARPATALQPGSTLSFPYEPIARSLPAIVRPPYAVLSDRPENGANLVMRTPGASVFDPFAPAARVLVVAADAQRAGRLGQDLGPGYRPAGPLHVLQAPASGSPARLFARLWAVSPRAEAGAAGYRAGD